MAIKKAPSTAWAEEAFGFLLDLARSDYAKTAASSEVPQYRHAHPHTGTLAVPINVNRGFTEVTRAVDDIRPFAELSTWLSLTSQHFTSITKY